MAAAQSTFLSVTVEVWHPDCWTLQTTRAVDAGLLCHETTRSHDRATGQFEVYGDSQDAVKTLIAAVRESSLTSIVSELSPFGTRGGTTERTSRSVVVESDPDRSIRSAFTSRGFLHYGPTRHVGGRERRSLLARIDRSTLNHLLEDIETAYDADIEVVRVTSADQHDPSARPADRLSSRQRDAFESARACGYYEYPRETTARDLAAELGVSKTTFLEHLHKAEAKLLTDIEL